MSGNEDFDRSIAAQEKYWNLSQRAMKKRIMFKIMSIAITFIALISLKIQNFEPYFSPWLSSDKMLMFKMQTETPVSLNSDLTGASRSPPLECGLPLPCEQTFDTS